MGSRGYILYHPISFRAVPQRVSRCHYHSQISSYNTWYKLITSRSWSKLSKKAYPPPYIYAVAASKSYPPESARCGCQWGPLPAGQVAPHPPEFNRCGRLQPPWNLFRERIRTYYYPLRSHLSFLGFTPLFTSVYTPPNQAKFFPKGA